jgi:hypothetical protein
MIMVSSYQVGFYTIRGDSIKIAPKEMCSMGIARNVFLCYYIASTAPNEHGFLSYSAA